ncbi:hypothetical protein EDC01DRAFT_625744, partial [Geopyxis carbonaria]
PKNFFELFPQSIPAGPPPGGPFTIDVRALQREFFALQQRSHPDVPAHMRTPSGNSSAYINKAYSTLKDPLSRAQYLLSLRNIDVAETETLQINDQELLMEVLEAWEEIEGAQTERDLDSLATKNNERIAMSLEVLEESFRVEDLETAKEEAVKLRYWVNIQNSINDWEQGKHHNLMH